MGNFYLMGKEDGALFTDGDEELLARFGSQAGAAIANARTHRAERRARADLEAVVETRPVGVAVFDAPSGSVASMNREAERIVICARLAKQRKRCWACSHADAPTGARSRFSSSRWPMR